MVPARKKINGGNSCTGPPNWKIVVIKNITHDIITNLNITLKLFIIFRYHTVDYLLKMSDILKIEYDLTIAAMQN
jgi:hypothetical protein